MTKLIDTAQAIVAVLEEHGPTLAAEFRPLVETYGGHANYIPDAAKYLRNKGVPVYASKARQNSEWRLDTAGDYAVVWQLRVSQEAYSEATTAARALYGSKVPSVIAARNRLVAAAVNLGVDLGITASTVIQTCEPVMPAPTYEELAPLDGAEW